MTQSVLVAALMAPTKAQWDADVASGKMSTAQEAQYLTSSQRKLGIWVTSPLTK
jgi:hypothetical protein